MDNSLGKLIVVFIKGRNLPNKRTLGKQNPYCIARVGTEAKRSPADIRGGQTPGWDHEVRFDVTDIPEHRTLKLSVLDENDSKPELVGDTVIKLDDAFQSKPSEGYDHWHELQLKGKYAGEVYVEMTFYPSKPQIPKKKKRVKKPKSMMALSNSQQSHTSSACSMYSSNNSSRPLPAQPGGSVSASNSFNNGTGLPLETPELTMPELPAEFENMSVNDRPPFTQQPRAPKHRRSLPLPQQNQQPHTTRSSRSPSPLPNPPPPQQPPHMHQVPGHPASAPPDAKPRRKPLPTPQQGIPRKPVRSGLPPKPEFDGGMDEIPFSPEDYNHPSLSYRNLPQPPLEEEQMSNEVLDTATFAPEPVIPQQPKRLPSIPVPVDPGAGGYSGEGQWNVDQINAGFNDSIFNRVIKGNMAADQDDPYYYHENSHEMDGQGDAKPQLPPKIPMGMTRQEYYAVEPHQDDDDPYHYRVYA